MKKRMYSIILMAICAISMTACGSPKETVVEKSTLGNPIATKVFGGDPSVLVDGDTVYLYTGHDASTDEEVGKAI